jgi:hypothetical protein
MEPTGWRRPFDDPVPLPRGRQFVTLEDAARYIQKLAKAEQQLAEWQTAVEAMLLFALKDDFNCDGAVRAAPQIRSALCRDGRTG